MLDANVKSQLQQYLQKLVTPVEVIAVLDSSEASKEMHTLSWMTSHNCLAW